MRPLAVERGLGPVIEPIIAQHMGDAKPVAGEDPAPAA